LPDAGKVRRKKEEGLRYQNCKVDNQPRTFRLKADVRGALRRRVRGQNAAKQNPAVGFVRGRAAAGFFVGIGIIIFVAALVLIQSSNTFVRRPPSSDRAFAITALVFYTVFAVIAFLLEKRRAISS